MKKWSIGIIIVFLVVIGIVGVQRFLIQEQQEVEQPKQYWFLLTRGANREYLYHGIPGEKEQSKLIKTFVVKTGRPGERPTPLPQLVGREYWLLTKKNPRKS